MNQIIMTKAPPVDTPPEEAHPDAELDFVFLDFAFTNLRLGGVTGTNIAEWFSRGVQDLSLWAHMVIFLDYERVFQVDLPGFRATVWPPLDDFEY